MLVSYRFYPEQDSGNINAVFKFTTTSQVEYAVTFIEATRIIDILDEFPVLSNGIYLIIDAIHSPTHLTPLDARIGKTIADILCHYLDTVDRNALIIYNCEEGDGKQEKRFNKFNRWFNQYGTSLELLKTDKEILVPVFQENAGAQYVSTFVSIIHAQEHPRKSHIENEIIALKQKMMKDK